jgi:hypothetical protein
LSYIGRYERFIGNLKGQVIDGAFEVHHIVPRSLGGSNNADNLIKLTPRQHYIAHWMLWKAYRGKMAHAFFFMNNAQSKRRIGSKWYEKLRADAIKAMSGENSSWHGKSMPLDLREKLSSIHKERLKNPETRAKILPQISALQPDKEAYKRQAKSISSLVWLNDGLRSYRVKPEFVEKKLAEGLVHGRLINYIDDSYRAKRKLIASNQWAAVKSTGHTGLLIKV